MYGEFQSLCVSGCGSVSVCQGLSLCVVLSVLVYVFVCA